MRVYRRNILWQKAVPALLAALVLLPVLAFGKGGRTKQTEWKSEASARKADYVFMEAMRQNTIGNDDAYFELLAAAHRLSPSDLGGNLHLGYLLMALGQQDTTLQAKGYAMMRQAFDADPSNYYDGLFYGMVNNQLGNNTESIRVWHTLDSLYPEKPDVALKYAQALRQSGDSLNMRRSVDVLNRIERAEGIDLGLTSQKVSALLGLSDTVGVFNEVERLLGASKKNVGNLIYAGDVYLAFGKPDSAMAFYDRACEADPTNGLAYYKRAEFYRSTGDSIGFDREVFEAVRQEGLDLDVKLDIFRNYISQLHADTLRQGSIQQLFDTLLIQQPHAPEVRDLYSAYLIAANNFKGAAEQQEYALDADLSNADRWRNTVSLWIQAKNYDKAYELALRGEQYLPDNLMLKFLTASTLSMMDRDAEALTRLKSLLDSVPPDNNGLKSEVLCSMGDLLYKGGDTDSAFVCYDRALDANPDNLLALNNCAYFMAEQGIDLDRAEKMSAITVRQNPDNDTALDTYAWIFFKKKDFAKAKEIIDRALAVEGDNRQADVLHHAGDIYYMNGDPEQALQFWEEALALDPDNALLAKKVKGKTHYYE